MGDVYASIVFAMVAAFLIGFVGGYDLGDEIGRNSVQCATMIEEG